MNPSLHSTYATETRRGSPRLRRALSPAQLPPEGLSQKLLPLGGAKGLQRRLPHQGLEGGAFQQRAKNGAVLLHRRRAGLF